MEQKAPDELDGGDRERFSAPFLSVFICEGHHGVFEFLDATVGNRHPVSVACQVFQNMIGLFHWITHIDNPVFFIQSGFKLFVLIAGKPFGYALGCLNAIESSVGCGFISDCQICAVRKLAVSSISKNQKQKTHTTLAVSANGQVRDIPLSIRVLPFIFAKKRFAILILDHLRSIDSASTIEMRGGYRGIIGESVVMRELFETIKQIARSDAHVLIQGESGTGKELVVFSLHKESQCAQKNFVPVNCGALPEGLLESELFGHVKGAFTGADSTKKGRFAVADGGTLFLDEVGEW